MYAALYELTPIRLPADNPLTWVALFLLDDLAYYWFHRVSHESRFLWASHVVHHSSEHYNVSTALRQTWVPMTYFPFWLALPLLGFAPWMVLLAQSWSLIYQFWIHTERVRRLPRWAEAVLNTPSHHRVHHGSNEQYLDKNYAGILIVWDRLFGTFEPEGERVRYGLTTNIATFDPLRVAFGEYVALARDVRAANGWRTRAQVLLRGPAGGRLLGSPDRGQRGGDARGADALGLDGEGRGRAAWRDLADADAGSREMHGAEDLGVEVVRREVGVLRGPRPLVAPVGDDRGQRAQAAGHAPAQAQPHRLGHDAAQLARVTAHDGEAHVDERGMLQTVRRVGLGAGAQALDRRRGGVHAAQQLRELVEVAAQGEEVQLLLGGEVAVDERLVDPGGPCDRVDARVVHPAGVEQLARDVEDARLACLAALEAGSPGLQGRHATDARPRGNARVTMIDSLRPPEDP